MACESEISFLLPISSLTLLLLLLTSTASSQPTTNITLGSFLIAGDGRNLSWVSPNSHFAFGFYPISPNATDRFLLAIWFNLIPEKTLVWSANRDNPVQPGSRVDLTTDGVLQLRRDSGGEVMWSANATGASYGAMLDTGNFVLVGRNPGVDNNSFLWQSFHSPTDTLLPSQGGVEVCSINVKNKTSNKNKIKYHPRIGGRSREKTNTIQEGFVVKSWRKISKRRMADQEDIWGEIMKRKREWAKSCVLGLQ